MINKVFFPINLRKVRSVWKRSMGVSQEGFAGYTRTMMQTYEGYRVDPPLDLVLWLSEQTGISTHDLLTREVLLEEIPLEPLSDVPTQTRDEMEERKKRRIEGLG